MSRIAIFSVLFAISCATTHKPIVDGELPETTDSPELTTPDQLLEAAANSLEPSTRAQVIGALIHNKVINDEWALRGLYDPDPWVQRAAALELIGSTREHLVLDYLRRDVDPYVRGEIGAKIATLSGQRNAAALQDLWTHPNPGKVPPPLALPAAILGNQEATEYLGVALAKGDVALHHHFIAAVGRSKRPEFIPYLQQGQESVEEELKLPYAAARVALGDTSGDVDFRKAFNDPNPEVGLEALDLLIPIRSGQVVPLLRRAQSTSDEDIRWYATLALCTHHQGPTEKLFDALDQNNWEIRLWATRFAGQLLADKESSRREKNTAHRTLVKAAIDEHPVVRAEVAKALRWADPEVTEKLIPLFMSDTELDIRLACAISRQYHPAP